MGRIVGFKFEELAVYWKAIDFIDKVYALTREYPNEEIFCLTSQLRRAAISVSLNIAEGSSRTKKDFCRFLDVAKGSVHECVAVLEVSLKQNYINRSTFEKFREYLVEISKMLSGLKRSLTQPTTNSRQVGVRNRKA